MSHHYTSPTAIEDGRLNLLDVYVFPETPGTSTLVLAVNPDSGRSSPTTFRADALYEFVIAGDGGTAEDRAFRMSFGEPDPDGDQEMRVRYAVGGPSRPGREDTELGVGRIGEAFALDNGGRPERHGHRPPGPGRHVRRHRRRPVGPDQPVGARSADNSA